MKKKIKRKEKFSTTKFVQTKNHVFERINDDDEIMKDIEIKFAFVHKLMKKIWSQWMKNIIVKIFFNCFDVFQKNERKKQFDESFFFDDEIIKNVKKN